MFVPQEDEFWGFFCEDLGLRPYRSVEASRSKATVGTSRFGRRLVVRRPEVSVRKSREEEETRNCEERDDTLKLFSGRKRSLEGLKGGLGDGEEKKIACTVELKGSLVVGGSFLVSIFRFCFRGWDLEGYNRQI